MFSHAKLRPSESDDAFSDMPEFDAKPHDTSSGYKKTASTAQARNKDSKGNKNSSLSEKPSEETGTKIYIGKKITDTHEINRSHKKKDTTLTDVSIDTDFETTGKTDDQEENKPLKFSETTITSLEPSKPDQSPSLQQPLILEEEMADAASKSSESVLSAPARKEKNLQSNISLDITPEEYRQKLPSGNDRIQLGSGIVTGLLGSGGMAKVYRTWNEKLEVYRAVKILIPTNQKIAWNRFLTEAKISAKLHHPNIIEVHTIGDWHGIPYIEMDIVEGETLSSLISRFKALPSMLISAIAAQVAGALSYAHCLEIVIYGKTYRGLIHRDLKPSNIMIGNNGIVKLMDFGVARPVETGLHTIDTENVVGTIHYFSPEQISGYPIDPLSDIYSFGAVMYEMLCGRNPFPQSSMIQLIRAKEKNQFIRLEDHGKPIDPSLASAAQVCLRTDKNGRFQSAADLCSHLQEIHRSFNMGTAEEVVRKFLQNPQQMFQDSDALLLSREEPESKEQSFPSAQVVELDTTIMNSSDIVNDDTVYQTIETDSEYLRVKKRRSSILTALIILLILLLVAGIIFFLNNSTLFSDLWSGPQRSGIVSMAHFALCTSCGGLI